MRKVVITIVICLFAATATSYAKIYENQTNNSTTTGYSGGLYLVPTSEENFNSDGGLYRGISGPGGRPGIGDGIGQNTPVGDDLGVLLAGCLLLGVVKFFSEKKTNKKE